MGVLLGEACAAGPDMHSHARQTDATGSPQRGPRPLAAGACTAHSAPQPRRRTVYDSCSAFINRGGWMCRRQRRTASGVRVGYVVVLQKRLLKAARLPLSSSSFFTKHPALAHPPTPTTTQISMHHSTKTGILKGATAGALVGHFIDKGHTGRDAAIGAVAGAAWGSHERQSAFLIQAHFDTGALS